MRPPVDRVLKQLATTLIGEIAPLVQVEYVQKNTLLVSMLLVSVAEEWDRAAERRVEENRELRRIFAEAAPAISKGELRTRLETAASEKDLRLRIRDLDASNDALRGLLMDLHAHVEGLETEEAGRIESEIWRELAASTERRSLSVSPF